MSHYYRQKRERSPETPASPRYARRHDERQPLYSGNPTQKHTQGHHRPVQRLERLDEDEMEADIDGNGDEWPPPMATRVYRYDGASQGGSMRYEFHPDQVQTYPNIPRRSSRAALTQGQRRVQEPLPAYEEDEEEPRTRRPGTYRSMVRCPWYALLAVGAILALTLWIGGAWINRWWTETQNDWTYTQAFRTFSLNAVVGHNHDSARHPSHFIVQNDNRHIIIVELPANDVSKAIIYSAPTLIGDGQEKTPVTISFQANPQTGRLDLVLLVQDTTYTFPNNGTKFITPQGQ
jgi:hypothetical protein